MSVEMGSPEITHGLCNFGFLVFWFFHGKPKNQNCTDHVCRDVLPRDHPWSVQFWFFGFFMENQKTKKTKLHRPCLSRWAPQKSPMVCAILVFWFFGFFMENQKTKKPKLHRPCLSRWAPQRSPMVCAILVFCFFFLENQKTKKPKFFHGKPILVFWFFGFFMENQKTKKPKLHRPCLSRWAPQRSPMVCAILVFWFFGFSWKTKKPKNQNCTDHVCRDGLPRDHPWSVQFWSVQFWFFGFLVFPGFLVFIFRGPSQRISDFFWWCAILGFWVFGFSPQNGTNHVCPDRLPRDHPMVCAILGFWVFGFYI